MSGQVTYQLSAAKRDGEIVDLGGFLADDDAAAQREAANALLALVGGADLALDDVVSIVGPDGPVGGPASVSEFLRAMAGSLKY